MHRFLKWRQALAAAHDEAAVTSLLDDYRRALDPAMVAALPAASRVILLNPASDVAGAAVELLQQELGFTGPEESAFLLHEIAHTYIAASARIAQLRSRYTMP